jgi:hypothetical protein
MKVKLCPFNHVNPADRTICIGFRCTYVFPDRPEPMPNIRYSYPIGTNPLYHHNLKL